MEEKGTAKQKIGKIATKYFITAFSGMAQGLFVTLIAGTILSTVATYIIGLNNFFGATLNYIASIAKSLMGAGIGVGIAYALKKNKLLIFVSAVAGMIGAFAGNLMPDGGAFSLLSIVNKHPEYFTEAGAEWAKSASYLSLGAPGNPIGAYVVVMLVVEVVGLYAGKTKLDILIVPLGALLLSFIGIFISAPFIYLVNELGILIAKATGIAPFFMGIIIAVVMGVLLTMPTSSAAIWIAISKSVIEAGGTNAFNMYIAGGAAVVGCSCQMVGFAVASFRENKWSGVISQGIGTSMLQIPNIMKKPIIMLPMIISSAILGPLSTCVFMLKCGYNGGGMGTSGFVGIIDLLTNTTGVLGIIGIFLLNIVLPIILNLLFSELLRKKGLIKLGDMKLPD